MAVTRGMVVARRRWRRRRVVMVVIDHPRRRRWRGIVVMMVPRRRGCAVYMTGDDPADDRTSYCTDDPVVAMTRAGLAGQQQSAAQDEYRDQMATHVVVSSRQRGGRAPSGLRPAEAGRDAGAAHRSTTYMTEARSGHYTAVGKSRVNDL